ncbi:Ig-like domain-containing protein [Pseudomonas alkylphenolica]|uniref:Ig-like domain-containing protein n=1 Tax=Pseudomonas alkylphenolica TaxID=237609 RepID=A0A077FG32_9PSED|nr:Ig-like domain-containing protein [Pseudomonas alkylphenolica]
MGVKWGKKTAWSAVQAGSYTTIDFQGKDIPEGEARLSYMLYYTGNTSASVKTLFRKGQPGVQGNQGVGLELPAPDIDLPVSGVIGPKEAKAKVKVTIQPWLSMNEHDELILYWGDQEIVHVVTNAELNQPIIIEVDENTIKAEGDSKTLPVYYYVVDLVGNESEWSKDAIVEVMLTINTLSAPSVLDYNGAIISTGEIDLGNIRGDHAIVQVITNFQATDSVLLHWVGTSQQGQAISLNFGPLVVTDPSKPLQFEVPFDEWAKLGGGGAQFSYTLTSNNTTQTSQKGYINVKGMPALMPLVGVQEASHDWVDADEKFAHVKIPRSTNLRDGDEVTVLCKATKADGSSHLLQARMFRISSQWVNKDVNIRLSGATYLKPFDGGHVEISYEVKRGKRTFTSQVGIYYIGYVTEVLAAPIADPLLVNDRLDPTDSLYQYGLDITIPAGVEQPSPCTITLYWETDDGGYYEDTQVLQAGDQASYFTVPESELKLNANAPVEVTVYYTIEWPGKPILASYDYIFTMATAAMLKSTLPAPLLPQSNAGTLKLVDRSDNKMLVRVPRYSVQEIGDELIIIVGKYSSQMQFITVLGLQDVSLPLSTVLQANLQTSISPTGRTIPVSYQVIRNGTTQKIYSDVFDLQLEGAWTFEDFEGETLRLLPKGTVFDLLGSRATVENDNAVILNSTDPRWYPTVGKVLGVYPSAWVRFDLRGLAKSVSFDISDHHKIQSVVRFYTASGTEIGSITTPDFSHTPAGYTEYSTRVTYTSPNAAIASFRLETGAGGSYVDNISYTPL